VSPQFCSAGSSSCLYPTPQFNPSGNLTGQLQVIPSLVQKGQTTSVNWNVSYVSGCTVTGSNGDSWSGTSGAKTSSPIQEQTTYTLLCPAYGSNAPVNESEEVNATPSFEER
jgi:hypothetical protein